MTAPPAPKPMVNWTDFKGESLKTLSPKEVTYGEGTPNSGKYKKIEYIYEYNFNGQQAVDGFLMQFPCITAPFGVQVKPTERGYDDVSIMLTFDLNKIDANGAFTHRELIDMLRKVHARTAECIFPVRFGIGMEHFTLENPVGTGLKDVVYNPRDKVTGEPTGKNPSQFYKMSKSTRFDQPYRDEEGEVKSKRIPMEILKGAEITGYPLIRFTHVYAGGKGASIQARLESMVVTDVRPANDQTRQTETIQNVLEMNPDISGNLDAQIAALTGGIGNMTTPSFTSSEVANESTVPGIGSTIPQSGAVSAIPIPGTVPTQESVPIPGTVAPVLAPALTPAAPVLTPAAPVLAPTQDLSSILAQGQLQSQFQTQPQPQPQPQVNVPSEHVQLA